jgi:hypothetical protein
MLHVTAPMLTGQDPIQTSQQVPSKAHTSSASSFLPDEAVSGIDLACAAAVLIAMALKPGAGAVVTEPLYGCTSETGL